MRRRDFIVAIGTAAASPIAWPLAARAQQGERVRRVGVLMNFAATQTEGQSDVQAFIQGLRQSGWNEGRNIHLDVRWNDGDAGLAKIYAAQLIGVMPDVILASSTTNLTAIRQATNSIPVVFVTITDPLAQGFVASVRRPGGNLTGFYNFEFSVGGKWLDLLKQSTPGLTRAAVMFNPDTSPQSHQYMRAIEDAAQTLGVMATAMPVRAVADIEPALASFSRQPNSGLILTTDSFTRLHQMLIADLALRYRLPSISYADEFAGQGGLMNYSTPDVVGQFRQAAGYVDRILKGEKPGDLPVQGADRYKFIINLKTARALGLTIPPGILAIADAVLE